MSHNFCLLPFSSGRSKARKYPRSASFSWTCFLLFIYLLPETVKNQRKETHESREKINEDPIPISASRGSDPKKTRPDPTWLLFSWSKSESPVGPSQRERRLTSSLFSSLFGVERGGPIAGGGFFRKRSDPNLTSSPVRNHIEGPIKNFLSSVF